MAARTDPESVTALGRGRIAQLVEPVSYTHLDVYKRQTYDYVFFDLNPSFALYTQIALAATDRLIPVSYTHLDVYKRQHQCYTSVWMIT